MRVGEALFNVWQADFDFKLEFLDQRQLLEADTILKNNPGYSLQIHFPSGVDDGLN